MENCIFCKIAHDEIPTRKAHHEDGQIVSFLDINQRVPGHTLVIPTEHYRWFYDLPENLYVRLFRAARHIAEDLKKEYNADYVQLAVVGEAVPHVHVHLLPRKLTDKVVL
jgi:histidine triad (HIT) family protein